MKVHDQMTERSMLLQSMLTQSSTAEVVNAFCPKQVSMPIDVEFCPGRSEIDDDRKQQGMFRLIEQEYLRMCTVKQFQVIDAIASVRTHCSHC